MAMVSRRRKIWRRGTTAVETAIVFPLLLLVTLGALRYGWLFLKAQQITNAARYGARIAIRPAATNDDVEKAIRGLFALVNITGETVSYSTPVENSGTGTVEYQPIDDISVNEENEAYLVGFPITVTVSVPCKNVDIMAVPLLTEREDPDWELTASATMTKEGP